MKNSNQLLYWAPRILCILSILFVSVFALDAFKPGTPVLEQLEDFATHLVPSFILVVLLVVAWNWELVGGIIFMLLGLVLSPMVFTMNYNNNHSVLTSLSIILLITFPFILVGILFILHHKKSRTSQ